MKHKVTRAKAISEAVKRREAQNAAERQKCVFPDRRFPSAAKPETLEAYAKSLRCATCLHRDYCPDSYAPAADECTDDYLLDLERVIAFINAGRAALPGNKRRRPITGN